MESVAPRLRTKELISAYETYGALMLRRCRLITRDANWASEAFQAAYIELIEYGSAFRKVESKLRWLYTLCDRSCFAILQKRGEETKDDYVLDVLDESENIGVRLECRQSVTSFWNDLADDEKQIAVLKYVDGLTQSQIHDEVGLSRQTVNKKIAIIIEKAEALAEEEIEA